MGFSLGNALKSIVGGAASGGAAAGPWGAIIGGAAGLAGSALSANASKKAAKTSAQAAQANTATQLDWERERAKNAIQWAKQDALAAGINPAVAAGQPAQTSGINPQMPDTSGIAQSGQALAQGINSAFAFMQKQQEVDSQSQLNDTEAVKNQVETGLMPRETAVKEMNAITEQRRQKAEEQMIFAHINKITALLPYETEQAKNEAMIEAMRIAVEAENNPGEVDEARLNAKIRKLTFGFTDLRELKNAAKILLGGATYVRQKRLDRTSAEKIARNHNRNHRTQTYNSKGKLQSETYYEYAD